MIYLNGSSSADGCIIAVLVELNVNFCLSPKYFSSEAMQKRGVSPAPRFCIGKRELLMKRDGVVASM
ncbi:MAG: hypothetical protein Q4E13_03555 [Clostridia bacterium]|nr:hypothetical protein [Clostridia bacterium]